jgi:hypothetical protein
VFILCLLVLFAKNNKRNNAMTTGLNDCKPSAPAYYPEPEAKQVSSDPSAPLAADLGVPVEVSGEALTPNTFYYTDVKIKRIALYVLATVCVISGAALIGLSVTGVIPAAYGYLAVPLFCLAIASVCVAMQMLDYENPEELQSMKDQAPHLTYQDLVSKHGLEKIMQYKILPLDQLREKLFTYIRGTRFCSFYEEVPKLHEVLTFEEFNVLSDLRNRVKGEISNLKQIETALNNKYPHRLNQQLAALDDQEQNARREYDTQIQKTVNQWNNQISSRLKQMQSNTKTNLESVEVLKTHLEKEKATAVARSTKDAQNRLNEILKGIQSQRARISKDPIILEQQENYNQEIEKARREYSVALESIEIEFSNWQQPS